MCANTVPVTLVGLHYIPVLLRRSTSPVFASKLAPFSAHCISPVARKGFVLKSHATPAYRSTLPPVPPITWSFLLSLVILRFLNLSPNPEEGRSIASDATVAPPASSSSGEDGVGTTLNQRQQRGQRGYPQPQQPSRRVLRRSLPGDDDEHSTRKHLAYHTAPHGSEQQEHDSAAPTTAKATETGSSSTTARRSTLRKNRAPSFSPTPPPLASQQQQQRQRQRQPRRDGPRRRRSRGGVGLSQSPETASGIQRHSLSSSSSLGPGVRFSTTASGEEEEPTAWQERWGGRRRQPRQLCPASVVPHAAQQAAEDLLSVRGMGRCLRIFLANLYLVKSNAMKQQFGCRFFFKGLKAFCARGVGVLLFL